MPRISANLWIVIILLMELGCSQGDPKYASSDNSPKIAGELESWVTFLLRGAWGKPKPDEGTLLPSAVFSHKGSKLSSWRFSELAKWGDDYEGPRNFYAPWYAEANRDFAEYSPYYFCFTEEAKSRRSPNIVAVTGPQTAFDPDSPTIIEQLRYDTILLLTINGARANWMEPFDVDLNWIEDQLKTGGAELGVVSEGFHVAFADGVVFLLKRGIPFATLRPFLLRSADGRGDREDSLGPYLVAKYSSTTRELFEQGRDFGAARPSGIEVDSDKKSECP